MLQARWLEVGQDSSGRRAGSWGNHGNGCRRGLAGSRLASPTAPKVGNGSGDRRDWQVLRSASVTLCIGVSVLPHPLWRGPGMLWRAAITRRGNGLP